MTTVAGVDNRRDGDGVDIGVSDSTEVSMMSPTTRGSVRLGAFTRVLLGLTVTLLVHPG